MVKLPPPPSLRPTRPRRTGPAPRRRSRRHRRGITVYVVLLVIAMLSAVGIFASRSASLATAQSGYFRQMVQTHYVTELAVLSTIAAIESDTPGMIAEMEAHSDAVTGPDGFGAAWRQCRTHTQNQRCYKFGRAGVETRLGTSLLENRPTSTAPLDEPGSLGRARVDASFIVEATDLAAVAAPISGERAVDMPVAFYNLTLSATGQVGPPTATTPDPDDPFRSAAVSLETARVHVTVGPLPAR